jgi:hypothetical protein
VSLLAEARGQKVIPNAKTILDLKNPSIVKVLSRDLEEVIQQALAHKEQARVHLQHLLRAQREPEVRPARARTVQGVPVAAAAGPLREDRGGKWELRSVRPIPYNDIPEEHLNYVKRYAAEYFAKKRYDGAREDRSPIRPGDPGEPGGQGRASNKRRHREIPAGRRTHGLRVDIIGPDDIDRIAEYDALLDPREHPRERPHLPHGAEGPERRAWP